MKKNSNEVIFRKGDKVRAIRDHFMPKKFRPYNEGGCRYCVVRA